MKPKRIIVFILNLLIAIRLSISVFAAGSATASVPVTLTVANEYRAVNVTVPVSLPVHIINGKVITADNARITNNSENGSVQVMAVKVTDGAYRVGSYDDFSGNKTIALKINNCVTKGAGNIAINSRDFPVIKAGGSLPLIYHAKISGDAPNDSNVEAAKLVFTISIAN